MIDYEQKSIAQVKRFAKSITCDICGKTIDYSEQTLNQYEAYNFISIRKSFGYGSDLGDCEELNFDICEKCLIEKFGKEFLVKHLSCEDIK